MPYLHLIFKFDVCSCTRKTVSYNIVSGTCCALIGRFVTVNYNIVSGTCCALIGRFVTVNYNIVSGTCCALIGRFVSMSTQWLFKFCDRRTRCTRRGSKSVTYRKTKLISQMCWLRMAKRYVQTYLLVSIRKVWRYQRTN
jgi:hypothetical protein